MPRCPLSALGNIELFPFSGDGSRRLGSIARCGRPGMQFRTETGGQQVGSANAPVRLLKVTEPNIIFKQDRVRADHFNRSLPGAVRAMSRTERKAVSQTETQVCRSPSLG